MPDSTDDEGDDRDPDDLDPSSLSDFLDGISEKMGAEYGRVDTRQERREVKEQIARELGVEEEYTANVYAATNEDLSEGTDERRKARAAVEERYERLVEAGKIQEAAELEEAESVFEEVNRDLVGSPP